MTADTASEKFKIALRARAKDLGFDVCRVARAQVPDKAVDRFRNSLRRGDAAAMTWLAASADVRGSPSALWADVRSVIVLGFNYAPEARPSDPVADPRLARISVHALSRDYHDVLKGRAKTLGQWLVSRLGGDVRVYVDSAPVMEKPLAESAGAGWQGRSTLLINERFGPWLLLADLFTSAELEPDPPVINRCGPCRRCVDACPTGALRHGLGLDARRCLAYLITEEKGIIPPDDCARIGNRIFGCDDCLLACPWGRAAPPAVAGPLAPRVERRGLRLSALLSLDDAGYRALFAGSGVRRLGFARFRRNVLIAAGNSGDADCLDPVRVATMDPDPMIAETARWALARLTAPF